MAKIDTTKIEGYDEMTPEQKIEALTAFELTAEPDKALIEREARLKKALDRSMSDTAEYKRQVRAMQTEAERAAAEKAEADAAKEAELQALRREKSISQYQAKLLQIGYSAELAAETAIAMADQDVAKVMENQARFRTEIEQKVRTEEVNRPANLTKGKPPSAQIIEQQRDADYRRWFGLA